MINLNLLTIEELCEKLQVSKNTAYNLLNSKKIKGLKVGRNWRVLQDSIEEYIAEQMNKNKGKCQHGY